MNPRLITGFLLGMFSCYPGLVSGQPGGLQGGHHYTAADGLPASVIYQTIQDDEGFVWIATEAGLVRFDGQEFIHYSADKGLPEMDVLTLFEGKGGKIWLQTLSYLCYHDRDLDSIIVVDIPEAEEVHSIFPDDNGDIWLTSRSVLIRLPQADPGRRQIYDSTILGSFPSLLGKTRDGLLVATSWQNKVFMFDPEAPFGEHLQVFENIPTSPPFRMIEDEQVGMIFNSLKGPRALANPYESLIPELASAPISVLQKDRSGRLWVGGSSTGLSLYERDSATFVFQKRILDNERINDLMEDRDGNLWVSTLGNGLFLIPESFHFMDYFNPAILEMDPTVYSLHSEGDSVLWIGGINQVIRQDRKNRLSLFAPTPNERNYNRTLEIVETAQGQILFVTDLGVSEFRNGSMSLSVEIAPAKTIVPAPGGGFWYGTGAGFGFCPPEAMTRHVPMSGDELSDLNISDERVYALSVVDSGYIWVGGIHGLFLYSQGDLKRVEDPEDLLAYPVSDMVAAPEGKLWVASNGGGVVGIQDDQFLYLREQDGLQSNHCKSLMIRDDLLYVGTNLGLSVFDISQSKAPVLVRTLTSMDGIPSNDIFDIEFHNGKIIVATSLGIVSFPRSFIFRESSVPDIRIRSLSANGLELNLAEKEEELLVLEEGVRKLQFEFDAIDFLGGNNLDYRYMLEGIDNSWNTGRVAQTRYIQLPHGNYRFKAQAKRTNNEEWSEMATLRFRVPRPWYFTWWFSAIVVIGLVGAMVGFYFFTIRRQEHQQLQQMVDEQTRKLRASNLELERSNKELREYAYVVSHDLKSPLRTISSFAQLIEKKTEGSLSPEVREYLDLVVTGSRKMNALIGDLLMYAQIGGGEDVFQPVDLNAILREVAYNVSASLDALQGTLDIRPLPVVWGIRHQLVLLFQNLVENGIKFRGELAPRIVVNAYETDSEVYVEVSDNGIGVDPKYQDEIFKLFRRLDPADYEGTGIGLSICKKISDLHNGDIDLESTLGKGSTFRVSFPRYAEPGIPSSVN